MYFTDGECTNIPSGDSGLIEVHFPAGASAVLMPINITNDDMYEYTQTYNIVINKKALPGNVVIGDPSAVSVIIKNDENSKQFMLSYLYCYLHLISTIYQRFSGALYIRSYAYHIRQNIRGGKLSCLKWKMVIRQKTFAVACL